MRTNIVVLSGSLVVCGLAGIAAAQEEVQPPATPPPPSAMPPPEAVCPPGTSAAYKMYPPTAPVQPVKSQAAYSPANQSLTAGGGVADFVRERISSNTSVAGAWDVRYIVGTRSFLAFEGSYIGTASSVNSDVGGNVMTNGATGALRFNMTRARVQPFLAAGGGFAAIRRGNVAEFEGVSLSRTTYGFAAPFSAGISGYLGRHVILEGRGAYTIITDKDYTTLSDPGAEKARPDMWAAELRAGYAF